MLSILFIVMAIGFEIEYVIHIAHSFLHQQGAGLDRTRNALEDMGLTVFSAFLSTAVQVFVLLIGAQSLAFTVYARVMMLVIIKGGVTGFMTVPMVLGLFDEVFGRGRGEANKFKQAA